MGMAAPRLFLRVETADPFPEDLPASVFLGPDSIMPVDELQGKDL